MSYELVINDQLAGQIGTNSGFFAMARYCETRGKEMRKFFEDGVSKNPTRLCAELTAVLEGESVPKGIGVCIKAVLKHLKGVKKGTIMFTQ